MPDFVKFHDPMQCLSVTKLPEGTQWEYELKLDGYRTLAVKTKGEVQLLSRNNKSFNQRFPGIITSLDKLPNDSILDGEAVAIDETGRPSFNHVQNFVSNKTAIHFYVFDVLAWKGKDLRNKQLWERRAFLKDKIIPMLPGVRFSQSFSASADEIVAAVRAQGLEGVVAKRLDSKCEAGERSGAWVKMRINAGQEFVIGGYTPAPRNFDALLIGHCEGNKPIFVAKTRNGFNPMIRDTVFKTLKNLRTEKCPFSNLPETKKRRWFEGLSAEDMKNCIWLKPKIVGAFEFAEWTPANHLRHSKFVGLREDTLANQVRRENPVE